jgi:ketosteroid isomerase-like protein
MSLRMRMFLASAAVVLVVVAGIAVAGAGTGGGTDDAQMIADARQSQRAVYAAYNDKKWDELRLLFAEDAIMLPPNHEPIRGRDAIIEFVRSGRDVVGEIDWSGEESAQRVEVSGKLVNFVYQFTAQSGRVRLMSNVIYERQPDGSVLVSVDEPSFMDPLG